MHRRRFLLGAGVSALCPLGAFVSATALGREIEGDLRRLTEPGAGDNRATFLPGGTTLLFASLRSGKSQIWSLDLLNSQVRRFHVSAANDFGRVAPNSDGTRICFSSDRGGQNAVYVLELTSGEVRCVSDPAFWSFGPTWSSRNVIAFFSRKGGNALNIWTVRPDGSPARQITNLPGESRQPWWSPDGGTLALSADHATGIYDVLLLDADGANVRSITRRGSCEQPFWNPDGRKIAISAKIDDQPYRIYVMEADGSDVRPIRQPQDADNVHPAWSPEGRSIVFTSGKGAKQALYILDVV